MAESRTAMGHQRWLADAPDGLSYKINARTFFANSI